MTGQSPLRIATRQSPLALWQAEWVADQLRKQSLEVELLPMVTKGDKILDQALSKVGGKDLFVKEVEHAVIDGRADLAVHSLKDMPTDIPDGLVLAAHPTREDPRDALVAPNFLGLDALPKGAKLGTSSLRRGAQLRRLRPDLQIVDIRGNVQTRLRKLEDEGMAATMLAYAGLVRLGTPEVATEVFSSERFLPAVGQGILGIECRTDDHRTRDQLAQLDDPAARAAAECERSFLARLQGGCQIPIGGHARVDNRIELRGMVASLDGETVVEGALEGGLEDGRRLGVELAEQLLSRGAAEILDGLRT
ncbi:MAG: hydroxymethylbilane synthase [Myxococcota bacterium]